jgi:hypothetical protein
MKKIVIAAVALGFLFTGAAWAQVQPNLDQGTHQLEVYGSYDNNSVADYQLNLGVGYGIFVSDNVEVGGVFGWEKSDLSDSLELGIVARYYFNTGSAWIPFLALGGLYKAIEVDDDVYNDPNHSDLDAWVGRFGGGVSYFFTNDVALSMSINYDFASDNLYYNGDGDFDDYNLSGVLGLQFYFN